MKYKLFGKSGLRVSELCLGTMTFGEEFGWGESYETSKKVFNTFAEAGGNFLDTANYYTKGTSEKMIGEFIASNREYFVLATKYSLSTNPKDPNASGNQRKNMVQALNNSLKRLKTDYIDIYWLHAWDYMTPVEEVMRAFDDMVRAGKILYIGFSDTPAWIIAQANTMANFYGWSKIAGVQLEYSLIERTIEREYFTLAKELDLSITAWSPLAMGVLTGKYLAKEGDKNGGAARFQINPEWGKFYLTERAQKITEKVLEIAKKLGISPAQIALNWTRQKCAALIPIIGAKTEKQLLDNLACLDFTLSREEMDELDAVSRIDLGFPHDFLNREGIKKTLLGDLAEAIENHR